MSNLTAIIVVTLLFAALLPLPQAEGQPPAAPPPGNQLINVGFRSLPPDAQEGGLYKEEKVRAVNHAVRFVTIEARDPALLHARLKADPNVLYVTEDRVGAVHALFVPNDPGYAQQYGWVNTNAPVAWDTTLGSTAVTVSVIDTGILASHPDLVGGRVLTGTSFVPGGNQLADDNGHGTHVAGTVGATTNNGVGGAGACLCNILPVKVLDSTGSGTFSAVANGITWAADHGAHIISLSLGCSAPCSDPGTSNAINYARNTKGVLVVVAAGNDGGVVGFPANDPNAFAVACTDSANAKCSFSNSGPEVAISAPGLDIYSTWNNGGYATLSGTSMSTPHVSGIAGLIKVANPSFTATDIANKIKSTATAINAGPGMGAGLVNAGAAVGPATPSVPGAPTLSGTAGNTQNTLSWTTPPAGSQPISGYKVYRGGALLVTLGVVTSYTDSGLTNGVAYSYEVTAVNSVGEGAKSNTVTLTPNVPPPTTVPGAPTGLTAAHAGSVRSGKIALNWLAPVTDGGSTVTNYKVYRSTVSGGETLKYTLGNVLSFTDSRLGRGVTYYYKVTAVNAIGESVFSNEASARG